MLYPSIKLHKNHIPLHPKLLLQTQSDYDYNIEVLLYTLNQLTLGVRPKYLVSLHYQHPVEHSNPFKETNKLFGFGDRYGFKTKYDIWKEVPFYKYWEKQRNEEQQVIKDTQKIKCRILKYLYGIKRFNREDKYDYPNLLFYHEKGKVKLQYHTHILLDAKNLKTNDVDAIQDIFDTSIKETTKCLSKWKLIDITPVSNAYNIMGYLNKETQKSHISFDFYNSHPILPHLNKYEKTKY